MSFEAPIPEAAASPEALSDFYHEMYNLLCDSGIKEMAIMGKVTLFPHRKFMEIEGEALIDIDYRQNADIQVNVHHLDQTISCYCFEMEADGAQITAEVFHYDKHYDEHTTASPNSISATMLSDLTALVRAAHEPAEPPFLEIIARSLGQTGEEFNRKATPAEMLVFLNAFNLEQDKQGLAIEAIRKRVLERPDNNV